eukprot:SAG22_NODE_5358_length_1028_cov_2.811625_2_plen_65_part_00
MCRSCQAVFMEELAADTELFLEPAMELGQSYELADAVAVICVDSLYAANESEGYWSAKSSAVSL